MKGDTYTSFEHMMKPVALTAAVLLFAPVQSHDTPSKFFDLEGYEIEARKWEEIYEPSILYDENDKIKILQDFAIKFLSESKELPPEFEASLVENLWDLL